MIERKIIYYPTIIVPSQWAKWAILYFDKVCSIVPPDIDFEKIINPWNNNDFRIMKILMSEGELEPVDPQVLLRQKERWRSVNAFSEELRRIVTSERFHSIINKNWRWHSLERVHRDKISYEVYEILHEQGLAEKDENSWNWILMEEKTSLLYMSLLAKYLADVNPDFMVPGTDRNEYEEIIYGDLSHQNGFISLSTKFINVLPTPVPDVPITNILEFKRKRKCELLHFREVMDEIYKNISMVENEAEIKQIILSYKEKINREVIKLRKIMKEENIKTFLGTFRSLLDIKSPTLLATLGASFTGSPLAIRIPILGFIATIQISYYLVDRTNEQRAKLRRSPFAYLHYAEKEGVI